ncbi:MAG: hypothetical protein ABSE49_27325 [Polyangiaceae bacterium]
MLSSGGSTYRSALLALAGGCVLGLTAGLEACGSAESNGAFGGSSSGGSGSSSSSGSSGGSDASSSGGSGSSSGGPVDAGADAGGVAPTTAIFVQASPSLPDVRLCWGTGGSIAPVVPFPGNGEEPGTNYPGIPLGGVASMSDASALTGPLTLYAIDAWNLAKLEANQTTPYTCDELVCGPPPNTSTSCLRYNLDYWPLPGTVAGLQTAASNVVVLGGCLPAALDPNASTTACGATWTALSGNLGAEVLQLQNSVVPEGGLAVQPAQLSPALTAFLGDGGAAVVSFGAQGAADASVVATLQAEGVIAAPSLVSVGTGLSAYGQLGFAVDVPGFDGGAGHLWMSLAESQSLVDPTQDPALFFGQPRTYLLAVIGDPNATHAFGSGGDAGYDGKGLHVLVVPAPAPPAAVDGGGD